MHKLQETPDVKPIPHWSKLSLREKVAQMIMVRIHKEIFTIMSNDYKMLNGSLKMVLEE